MTGGHDAAGRSGCITVPVCLDRKTFRRFAVFDALTVRKVWRRPCLFSLLMAAFAAAALLTRKEQSGLIAGVLLAVGVGLPVVYAGSFLRQVRLQADKNRLSPPRKVYTVSLTEEGLSAENHQREEETLRLGWDGVWKVWRRKGFICIYVTERRAFILPDGQADAPDDAVWALCSTATARAKAGKA